MSHYLNISAKIYSIYLRYVSEADIHVYSIDEVFMDVTGYLRAYGKSAHDMAREMIQQILRETGITATAGIGTNMYLAKWLWTWSPSIFPRIRMACVSRNWMRCRIVGCYGRTGR